MSSQVTALRVRGMVLDILFAMVETSYTCLPLTGRAGGVGRGREVIPGWSTELESNACYARWMTAGKPRQEALPEAKQRSHDLFRHMVRRVKRSEKLHQAQGLFGAAMEGDIKLLREMRRFKTGKGQMKEMAETVDGITGEPGIADSFATIFKTLYNSSESRGGDDQAAGPSQALLNGPDVLFKHMHEHLARIFRSWLSHGNVTKSVLACAIIPLVNGSKDPALTGSYSAIAGPPSFSRCAAIETRHAQ